jgi:hypothetical protein
MDQPSLIENLKRRDQGLVGPQVREGQVLADYLLGRGQPTLWSQVRGPVGDADAAVAG